MCNKLIVILIFKLNSHTYFILSFNFLLKLYIINVLNYNSK